MTGNTMQLQNIPMIANPACVAAAGCYQLPGSSHCHTQSMCLIQYANNYSIHRQRQLRLHASKAAAGLVRGSLWDAAAQCDLRTMATACNHQAWCALLKSGQGSWHLVRRCAFSSLQVARLAAHPVCTPATPVSSPHCHCGQDMGVHAMLG